MVNELKPKIWEFRVVESDNPDLILDYYHADKQVNFTTVAGAIEQIIGVHLVTVSPEGAKMRVVLHNTRNVYNKLAPIFERLCGIVPFASWRNFDVQL